jgi:hypothetical protein
MTGWFERAARAGLVKPGVDANTVATAFLGSLQFRAFLSHLAGDSATNPPADLARREVERLVALLSPHLIESTP